MEINNHLFTMFRIQPHSKQQTKQPPHNNGPKRLLLKASSYLSIWHFLQQKTTFTTTIKKNFFSTWPGLTAKLIIKHLNGPPATILGHIKQERQGLCSTKFNSTKVTPSNK